MYNPVNDLKKMQLHPIKNEPSLEEMYEPIGSKNSTEEDNSCEGMSRIIQFPNGSSVFVSGINTLSPPDFRDLQDNKIKVVISVTDDLDVIIPPIYRQYWFKVMDTPTEPINRHFENTWIIVSHSVNNGENVLIHCRAGISRSVTLFISFMLRGLKEGFPIESYVFKDSRENWSQAILRYVQTKRVCANPNMGFMIQLYRYEQNLKLQMY